jgi:hypothetical protein
LKEDLNNKIRLNTHRTRGSTKSSNDPKRESVLQSIKNPNPINTSTTSIIKEDQRQINSIQTFVVNSVKSQNPQISQNSQNTSQISNFSNINISNDTITTTNNSMLNNTANGFCPNPYPNLERNRYHNNNSNNNSFLDENNMIIDEVCLTQNQNQVNNINNNFQNLTTMNQLRNTFINNNHLIQVQSHTNSSKNSSPKEEKITKSILKPEEMMTGNPNVFNPKPQLVDEYIDDIFQHLKEIEFNITTNPHYMKSQTDINEKMRSILIDWLVEVHLKFKLVPETLFLTVNLIDRYLNKKIIMRNRLQLVGVTAMLIACKYEEIYAPEVKDFVYITDKAYTKEEIFAMENDILFTLDFNVTVPSSFRYMEIFNRYLKLEENAIMFCRYLLELFLIEYKMIKYNPSLLAASTMYITLKITKKTDAEKVTELIGYTDEVLKECAKDICQILDNVEKNSLQAVRNKFSLPKFMEVAKIKFN